MLDLEKCFLLMIDVQEKLVNMLKEKEEARQKSLKLIWAADILGVETLITEQYPKGLLSTIDEIKECLKDKYRPFEKTAFAASMEDEIYSEIIKTDKKQVVLFGIEAHICVFQTALDLKEKGFEVFVVNDVCYSRCEKEKELAMQNLRHKGIMTPSLESVLFMWLKSSKHPKFKEVQALIK